MEPFHQPDDIGHAPKTISRSAAAAVVTVKVLTRAFALQNGRSSQRTSAANSEKKCIRLPISVSPLKCPIVTFPCEPMCVFSPSTLTSAAKPGLINVSTPTPVMDTSRQSSSGSFHSSRPIVANQRATKTTDLWPFGRRQGRRSPGGRALLAGLRRRMCSVIFYSRGSILNRGG